MPIVPDARNWTFVLDDVCAECGYDVRTFPRERLGTLIRSTASHWELLLLGAVATLSVRPSDDRWSPLEYACHVRDVFRIFTVRLDLMVNEDDPLFANWDQDATAIEERYNTQDPATVSAELTEAAAGLADAFDSLTDPDWQRRGRRSDGASFDIESFGRYLIHDPVHHLWDVGAPLPALPR